MLERKEFVVTLSQAGDQETRAWGWRRGVLFVVRPLVTSQTTKHGWGDGSNIKT